MTIDHATDLLYPSFPAQPIPIALHIIGRLTAPIMWFFISEGYHYTHNIKKYLLRLGIFAVISHMLWVLIFVILVYPVMKQYNGQRGKADWLKWFFYIYYPAHLIVIGI